MTRTLTPSEALGLATQAVKEVQEANLYLRPVSGHNSHKIHDLLKPRGKQLVGSFDDHETMMSKLSDIRAERLAKAAAAVVCEALSSAMRESIAGLVGHRELFAEAIDEFNSAFQEAK